MKNMKQMEKNVLEPKKLVFEPPMISVIRLTENDIITTSGLDQEGEKVYKPQKSEP